MPDKYVSKLIATTSVTEDDLMLVVATPSSTPTNKKITISNFETYLSATTDTLTNKTLTSPILTTPKVTTSIQASTDAADVVLNQYDGTEVARIHDSAVVPTASGTSYTLSAGTGFGFRRRILTFDSGDEGSNLTLTAADSGSIIYVTPTEPVDLILPLVGTETGLWFDIIFDAQVNKAFEIKTSGQDGNDNITLMNQYVGPSQNFDVGGSDHDVLYIANANIGTRIEIINCAGGDAEKWHAYVRSLGSQAATIS